MTMARDHSQQADGQIALEAEGMPSVNAVKRSNRARIIVVFVLAIVVAGVGAFALVTLRKQESEQDAPKKRSMESTVPERRFVAPPPLPAPAPAQVVPAIETDATLSEPKMRGSTPVVGDPAVVAQAGPPPPTLDKSASTMMIEGATAPAADASATQGGATGVTRGAAAGGGPLDGLLTGTATPMRSASMLGDRNYILAKGSFINCALQTRLDSTVPGMASCRVTRNVYSDNGKVLLIERGSTVTGEYQANLKQGMARIYVLWTRVKTPNGVVVDLDSPGADGLGGAGVPGHINNHFWKRFGAAMLLSVIDDLAQFAAQQRKEGDTIRFEGTSEATQDMASKALEHTIDIPPTLYKNHGDEVGIFIARDLDFSGVYRVEPK